MTDIEILEDEKDIKITIVKEENIKDIIHKIIEVIENISYKDWDKIKYTIENLYICSSKENTLKNFKDIEKVIDNCI